MENGFETKEYAREWVEGGMPCEYMYGLGYRGARPRPLSREKALELLPKYSFGTGFYELYFVKNSEGRSVLRFNEYSEDDLY